MKPHIAVNTRLLLPGRQEGISRFAVEVLQRLTQRNPELQFTFYFDRPFDPAFIFHSNIQPVVLPPPARHPVLWYLWFHGSLSYHLARTQPDVLFSPEFYLCPNSSVPQVPVFHDLAYEHYPEDIGKWAARYCRKYSPRYARKAATLLTVSEFSKQDIIYQYGIAPEKIEVVYNGVGEHFRPASQEQQVHIRRKFAQGDPYFLFVGTVQPRKNIETLLQAFDQFKAQSGHPMRLVIAGRKGWQYQRALETYQLMQHRDAVHFTGYVPEAELPALYSSAAALCYLPYLEGFGIPLLEAMACGTPIICSNVSSLPEVVGDAALQVDPFATEKVTEAMIRLMDEPGLVANLVQKGRVQCGKFSWEKTYEAVWRVLQQYLNRQGI